MKDSFQGTEGFIYCLTNQHLPGLVKIGVTRKHPLQRAKELGLGSGVPDEYQLAYYRDFADAFAAESSIHDALAEYRVNPDREFFRLSVEEAVVAVDKVAHQVQSQGVTGGTGQRCGRYVATPFAELYASFKPSDDPFLHPDEIAQVQALRDKMRRERGPGWGEFEQKCST